MGGHGHGQIGQGGEGCKVARQQRLEPGGNDRQRTVAVGGGAAMARHVLDHRQDAAGDQAVRDGAPEGGDAAGIAGRRWINDYQRSKTISDRRARRAIAEGAPLSVIYPGVIYGPGELTEGNILVRHLLDLAHGRLPALVGKAERRWNYVFVEDVAAGIVATLEQGISGRRYMLGGENVTQGELYRLVAEIGGIRVPQIRMPDYLATASGAAMKFWARLAGGVPRLTPDLVEIYRHDWAYDSSTAAAAIGYRPRSLRDGLAATIAWLRETGAWPV